MSRVCLEWLRFGLERVEGWFGGSARFLFGDGRNLFGVRRVAVFANFITFLVSQVVYLFSAILQRKSTADTGSWFFGFLFQETKLTGDQLDYEITRVEGYDAFFSTCRVRGGYSGVATFCRNKSWKGLSISFFDWNMKVVLAGIATRGSAESFSKTMSEFLRFFL